VSDLNPKASAVSSARRFTLAASGPSDTLVVDCSIRVDPKFTATFLFRSLLMGGGKDVDSSAFRTLTKGGVIRASSDGVRCDEMTVVRPGVVDL